MNGRAMAMCAAAALISCAPAQRLPDADLTDSQGWIFMDQLNMAAFAAPDPREYALIVACDGPERLRLYHRGLQPEELNGDTSLMLQSGPHELTLAGQRQDDRVTPPPVVEAEPGDLIGISIMAVAPLDSAVLRNFLDSGELQLRSGAHVTQADAAPNETAALRAMWERCA